MQTLILIRAARLTNHMLISKSFNSSEPVLLIYYVENYIPTYFIVPQKSKVENE